MRGICKTKNRAFPEKYEGQKNTLIYENDFKCFKLLLGKHLDIKKAPSKEGALMGPQGLELFLQPYVVHILLYRAVFQDLCSIFII